MSALNFNVEAVFEALARQSPKSSGQGRALMFIAARRGDGASAAVRAVCESLGEDAVLAVDLDLQLNALARSFAETAPLGPPSDGRFNGASFCAAVTAKGGPIAGTDAGLCFHRVGRTGIQVAAYVGRGLPKGTRLVISDLADYWDGARAVGMRVMVCAPALEHSRVGLRVGRHMDGVVLVVDGGVGSAPAALDAKAALERAGANLIGIVYDDARTPLAAIERWIR